MNKVLTIGFKIVHTYEYKQRFFIDIYEYEQEYFIHIYEYKKSFFIDIYEYEQQYFVHIYEFVQNSISWGPRFIFLFILTTMNNYFSFIFSYMNK